MTTTPPEAPPGPEAAGPGNDPSGPQGSRTSSDELRNLARMRRTVGPDKKIAGVAGGLARHLDIDPLLVRVALVVLVFFGGAGLIVYGAVWLLVPQDGDAQAPFNFDDRTRTVALVIAGVIATLSLLGDAVGEFGFPWPLAILALIVLVVVARGDRDRSTPSTAPPPPYAGPAGPQTQQGWTEPQPAWQAQAYTTQQIQQPPPQPRYRNPRRRGPVLFWFTLALSALGVGILGMVDAAGAGVADSAYPALVVGICGVMLVVGAFFGRAGGLILVGLLATLGMAGATASNRWDDQVVRTPATAAAVQDTYDQGAGELLLDLSQVTDPENLDGRSITVQHGAGTVEVVLPEGLDVDVRAKVGFGEADVFDDSQDGGGVDMTSQHDGGTGVPRLDLDISLGVGAIDVRIENGDS